MTPFAISLHVLRIRKRRLQADLCDALEVDRARVSSWERGLRPPPSNEMIERLCLELGADVIEAAELREAAKFSSRTVQIPVDTIPELYPLIHRFISSAANFTKADVIALTRALRQDGKKS